MVSVLVWQFPGTMTRLIYWMPQNPILSLHMLQTMCFSGPLPSRGAAVSIEAWTLLFKFYKLFKRHSLDGILTNFHPKSTVISTSFPIILIPKWVYLLRILTNLQPKSTGISRSVVQPADFFSLSKLFITHYLDEILTNFLPTSTGYSTSFPTTII